MASEWSKAQAGKDALLFAFGETITEADFGNAGKRRALRERLAALSTQPSDAMDIEDVEDATGAMPATALPQPQPPGAPADVPQATFRVVGGREVLLEDDAAHTAPSPRPRNWIPEVVAVADLQSGRRRIKMYDAVHEDTFDTAIASGPQDPYAGVALGPAKDSKSAAANPQTADDLVPMVRDYLSFGTGPPEYVYDFYYVSQAQTGMDPDVLRAANVGAVLWVDDADDFLADSDCAQDDEDEDSNAEDFYRNDYPDEPDSGSGMDEYYYSSDERGAGAQDDDRAGGEDYDYGGGDGF
ncbi:hypothetical protein LPJ61_004155 [Coemansia biformis]|uniref:Probable RNA polymerase II nuclear localization protein SLC7A6OS n=1 Tax=Coemansia biformis TaxID=1286918 RepID=A0A9W8CVM0_9FUNG|nr:hypothetical protein LPJ61_004155 [Coemansia biformis]